MQAHLLVRAPMGALLLAVIALGSLPTTARAFEPVGTIHFTWGGNWYDPPSLTGEARRDEELGADLMLGGRTWPVLPSAYYVRSEGFHDSPIEDHFEYTTEQIGIGITRVWSRGRLQPYTGGGWVRTSTEITPVFFIRPSFTEVNDGAWLGAGVTYRLGALLSAGVGGRFKVDVTEFYDTPVWSGAARLGIGWPASE